MPPQRATMSGEHADDTSRGTVSKWQAKALAISTCISISLNAITAGSIFTIPLWGPPLAKTIGLSMSQSNNVAIGAILGEYISAVGWGLLVDQRGPRTVSLCAAVLFAVGYGMMARSIKMSPPDDPSLLASKDDPIDIIAPSATWIFLACYYVLSGSATAASYFAAVTTATRSFPDHPGLAIAIPCALFGLSPLLISQLASALFVDRSQITSPDELDVYRFFVFLAITLFVVNMLGAYGLRIIPRSPAVLLKEDVDEQQDREGDALSSPTESSLLLPATDLTSAPKPITLRSCMGNRQFWLLSLIAALVSGPAEATIATLGNVIESVLAQPQLWLEPAWPGTDALNIRKTHVIVIAVCNTAIRLLAGPLSDWLSPKRAGLATTRTWTISRLYFLVFACLLFVIAFLWAAFVMQTPAGLWLLSVGVGLGYGLTFTLIPAIVSTAFPLEHFGFNWGLISLASAAGSFVFTALAGAVSDSATEGRHARDNVCAGRRCFAATFAIYTASCILAALMTVWLQRQRHWRGKV